MADLRRIDSKMLRSSTPDQKKSRAAQAGAGIAGVREKAVASHALFSGTIYLANLKFRRRDQGGTITGLSDGDIATVLEYMDLACPTILHYTSQYGQASATISAKILGGVVDINSGNYNTGDLENWIHTIAKQNGVGSNDCICVLNPPSMVDASNSLGNRIGGYHSSISSCRYIFVNLTGTGLTVADRQLNYADSLSHEMAEMIVDPDASSNQKSAIRALEIAGT